MTLKVKARALSTSKNSNTACAKLSGVSMTRKMLTKPPMTQPIRHDSETAVRTPGYLHKSSGNFSCLFLKETSSGSPSRLVKVKAR